jgi:hypothetical protein
LIKIENQDRKPRSIIERRCDSTLGLGPWMFTSCRTVDYLPALVLPGFVRIRQFNTERQTNSTNQKPTRKPKKKKKKKNAYDRIGQSIAELLKSVNIDSTPSTIRTLEQLPRCQCAIVVFQKIPYIYVVRKYKRGKVNISSSYNVEPSHTTAIQVCLYVHPIVPNLMGSAGDNFH